MLLKPPPSSSLFPSPDEFTEFAHLPNPQISLHLCLHTLLASHCCRAAVCAPKLPHLPQRLNLSLLPKDSRALHLQLHPLNTHSPASQLSTLLDHSYQETNTQPPTSHFPLNHSIQPTLTQVCSCLGVFAFSVPSLENMLFPDLNPLSEKSSLSTPSKAMLYSAICFYCPNCFSAFWLRSSTLPLSYLLSLSSEQEALTIC